MQTDVAFQVALIYTRWRLQRNVGADEYKRHLLNHMSYSHAYLSFAGVELAQANPTALCEAAMHAAACAWCLADYHNEASPPEPIPAEAWEGIANRWIKAVEKWSKQLKSNQAAAYAAAISERAALKAFPIPHGGESRTDSTQRARRSESSPGDTAGAPKSGDASPRRPIIASGEMSADDRAAREAFYAPPAAKRSHKKKPTVPGR